MAYTIEPSNEPCGEGNGWAICAEKDATCWIIWHDDEQLEAFNDRAKAYDWFREYAIENNLPTTIPHSGS